MKEITQKLADMILQDERVKAASVVAAFYPLKGEPDIFPVLQMLSREGRLLLPRCGENASMEFFKINNLYSELCIGHYGIREPIESLKPWVGNIPVFLVPGEKFDTNGGRKGHGMGYYDRFLQKYPKALKIGVCFEEQLQNKPLKLNAHDVIMDEVFSA